MRINVSELLKAVGNEQTIEATETVSYPEDNVVLTSPLQIKLHLVNTGETILMTGSLKTAVQLNCVRCLEKFDYPMTVEVEEEYSRRPLGTPSRGREVELTKEDFIFSITPDNTIDLAEAVRQNLIIALPLKALCKSDCEGIKYKKEDK